MSGNCWADPLPGTPNHLPVLAALWLWTENSLFPVLPAQRSPWGPSAGRKEPNRSSYMELKPLLPPLLRDNTPAQLAIHSTCASPSSTARPHMRLLSHTEVPHIYPKLKWKILE